MLIELTESGLYCAAGDFYIDPWRPVTRAIVTHAHGDHAYRGHDRYLVAQEGLQTFKTRLGTDAPIKSVPYGETVHLNSVQVSLHPAGHILGSAQVRVEYKGEVWVASGDYKVQRDPTCTPFEPIKCHTFISESTFGLPIYRWSPPQDVFDSINAWWRANQVAGKTSLLFGYALGKAQRLIRGVDPSIGPIYTHGAIERINRDYRESGIDLPPTNYVSEVRGVEWHKALIVAPPSAHNTPWTRKFGTVSTGFASGWMRIRGTRRRQAMDRGFTLSDHADWPGLMEAIKATGAQRVWVTHGYTAVMARWLREQGYEALALQTRFENEEDFSSTDAAEGEESSNDNQ